MVSGYLKICDLYNWLNSGAIHQDRDHLKEDKGDGVNNDILFYKCSAWGACEITKKSWVDRCLNLKLRRKFWTGNVNMKMILIMLGFCFMWGKTIATHSALQSSKPEEREKFPQLFSHQESKTFQKALQLTYLWSHYPKHCHMATFKPQKKLKIQYFTLQPLW